MILPQFRTSLRETLPLRNYRPPAIFGPYQFTPNGSAGLPLIRLNAIQLPF
jgi:hypothetical protein